MKDLADVPLFDRLDRDQLGQVSAIAKRRSVGADVAIVFEGDPSDALFVLLSGSAKVYRTDEDGTDQIVATIVAGELFGESSLLDGEPRSATVTTLEPSEVLSISHRDFRALVERSPALLWKVMESLTARMRRQNEELLELSRRDIPHRLLRTLFRLAKRHGELAGDGGYRLKMALSSRDLAGMVGSTPERVSRLMQRFEASGLVARGAAAGSDARPERILIPDLDALCRALEYTPEWA